MGRFQLFESVTRHILKCFLLISTRCAVTAFDFANIRCIILDGLLLEWIMTHDPILRNVLIEK